ncbi:MAG: 50S ribosomal protein L9 [Verrucomicrobiae bacterium]|nr:50S ribosomal protein L9 [Verrucomicrobiae bacterium]
MATTHVILTTPIRNLGAEGDKVKVKAGFARNFLIPTGKALPVTKGALKKVEELQKIRAEREVREINEANEMATKLNKLKINFTLKTGAEDKAFGSVTSNDIIDRLKAEGFELERRQVRLEKPVKTVGSHEVTLNLHADVVVNLTFEVVAEVAAPREEPKGKRPRTEKGDKTEKAPVRKKSKKDEEAPAAE